MSDGEVPDHAMTTSEIHQEAIPEVARRRRRRYFSIAFLALTSLGWATSGAFVLYGPPDVRVGVQEGAAQLGLHGLLGVTPLQLALGIHVMSAVICAVTAIGLWLNRDNDLDEAIIGVLRE